MKIKKIIICIIFLLILPIIFAAVARNIQDNWICPSESFNVRLKDGAITSYAAEETLKEEWFITGSSPDYTLKNPDPNDGIKKIAWFGVSPSQQILYTLQIPNSGSYSISGVYVLDAGGEKNTGTTNFVVHENTCITETEDDLDGDSCGRGCACPCTDCCDSGTENSMGCSDLTKTNIHKGAQEDNSIGENDGIDQDCNGCDFIDLDNDGYRKSGTGCGANDCDDSNPNVNPGKTEINCDNINNNCVNEACSTNGDCCPSTDVNDLTYYDQNCDCKIDYCNPNFIAKYLAGEIDPGLQMVIDAIPVCGYSNP